MTMTPSAEGYLYRILKALQGGSVADGAGAAQWKYTFLGEAVYTPAAASVEVDPIPANANCVQIAAEGGAAYFAINHTVASANSGGYVPEDNERYVYPITNLNTLHLYAGAGVTVHLHFYQV